MYLNPLFTAETAQRLRREKLKLGAVTKIQSTDPLRNLADEAMRNMMEAI